jgi:hypothetical protein
MYAMRAADVRVTSQQWQIAADRVLKSAEVRTTRHQSSMVLNALRSKGRGAFWRERIHPNLKPRLASEANPDT